MKSFPLKFALLMIMTLSSNALSQVRIAPIAGTQIWGRDAYNDSPFLGAKASIRMNQKLLLTLEYQGWNSKHEHLFGRPDGISPFSPKLTTNSRKQLLFAGLQYDLFPLSKKSHVIAGFHLGYQYLSSKNHLFNQSVIYILPPADHQEENLLGILSLSLNFELFYRVSLFTQLRYGHRFSNLDGSGISNTRHFAQILLGMDLLVF